MGKTYRDYMEQPILHNQSVIIETTNGVSVNDVLLFECEDNELFYVIKHKYGKDFNLYSKEEYEKFNSIIPIRNIPVYLLDLINKEINIVEMNNKWD